MEFDYTTTTDENFDEAVQGVQDEVAKAGMRVLYIHDRLSRRQAPTLQS